MSIYSSPYLLNELMYERQQRLQQEATQQRLAAPQPKRPARLSPSVHAQLQPHWPRLARVTSDFDLAVLLAKD